MREAIRDKGRLQHILQAIKTIEGYVAGMDRESFLSSPLVVSAVSYHIVVIGEAVYKLTAAFRQQHGATPWQKIEGMRHVMVHGYYQVNKETVWRVVEDDLPPLRRQISQYIDELEKAEQG